MSAQEAGRYTLLEPLARGGMGELWLARLDGTAGFSKFVVVKRLLAHLDDDPEFLSRFIDEARIAATLAHANIASVLDLGEDDVGLYLVMEWVDGWDLRKLIRTLQAEGDRLPDAFALHIAAELASALTYAHEKADHDGAPLRIVHRDVTPSNVLISRSGDVKLTDFGIASARSRLGRSVTGQLRGKFAYMAPEQAAGQSVDHRTDQYALGTLLYELLAGRKAFDAGTDVEVLALVRNGSRPHLSEARPDLSEDVVAVVERATALKPEDRYADTRAFEAALRGVLAASWPTTGRTELGRWLAERVARDPLFRAQDQPGGASLDAILLAQLEGGSAPTPSGQRRRDRSRTQSVSGRLALPLSSSGIGSVPVGRDHTRTHAASPLRRSVRQRWVAAGGVSAAAIVALLITLQVWPAPAQLVVRTEPSGAQVYLDGVPVGLTDLLTAVEPGRHEVQVRLPGYHATTQAVDVRSRQHAEISVALEPADRFVTFNSIPAGAIVTANGHHLVAGNAAPVPVGERVRVRMELDGHEPIEEYVTFTARDTVLTRRLTPLPVEDTATSRPESAGEADTDDSLPRAAPQPNGTSEARPPTRGAPRSERAGAAGADNANLDVEPGTLVLRFADPPMVGSITIDGHDMGQNSQLRTPFSLSPGSHRVRVENAASGLSFDAAVVIASGEEVPVTVRWTHDD